MEKNTDKLLLEIFDFVHDIKDDGEKLVRLLDFLKNGGLDEEPFFLEGGIYDDDGTKVDESSIPVPNLCVICKKHLLDDWEENLLCKMNRHDQRDDLNNFQCGAFEKM